MNHHSFRSRFGAALLALCLLTVCFSPSALASEEITASLAATAKTVYSGTRVTLEVTLSSPAAKDMTFTVNGGSEPLHIPVAAGETVGTQTVAAGSYQESTAETYSLAAGKDYTVAGEDCVLTVLPMPKLAFMGQYYMVTAGRSVPINVYCKDPESLLLPLPLSVRLSDGTEVASFTLDSQTKRAKPTVKVPKDWKLPAYLTLYNEASGKECARIALKVIDNDRQHGVRRVETDENRIAISFDCGFENKFTDYILDTLDEYGIKTTFFVTGEFVKGYPEMVQKIHDRGHEIGNHTMTHTSLITLSDDKVYSEISELNDRVEELTGVRPVILRPPYGSANANVIQICNMAGCELVYWTWDSIDWDPKRPAEEIISRSTDNVSNGNIILFHNSAPKTEQTLRTVLDYYKSKQWEIVPVSELMYSGHYTVDNKGVQRLDPDYRRMTAAALVGEQTFSMTAKGFSSPIEVKPVMDGQSVCRRKDELAAVQDDLSRLTVTLSGEEPLNAPVKAGDALGEASFAYGGEVWFTAPVTAVKDAAAESGKDGSAANPETMRLGKSIKSSYFFGAGIILLVVLFIGAMLMRPDRKKTD